MSGTRDLRVDPALDLLLERTVAVPPERVWEAWTVPEHLVKWFAPTPYTTSECEIDLQPGGVLRAVLCSPEGDEHDPYRREHGPASGPRCLCRDHVVAVSRW